MSTATKTMRRGTLEVKAAEGRTVFGFASAWELDDVGDVIEPGAYARWHSEWKESGRKVSLLDNHDYFSTRSALGVMTDAEETVKGLRTEFEVIEGPDGDRLLNQVKIGAIHSFSIGYEARGWREPTDTERKMGVRRVLQDIELMEVSAVIFPANRNATIEGVKAAMQAGEITEEEAVEHIRALLAEVSDPKHLRGIASQIGSKLRPPAAPSDEADPQEDEKEAQPEATPEDSADSRKAKGGEPAVMDPLRQRMLSVRLRRFSRPTPTH